VAAVSGAMRRLISIDGRSSPDPSPIYVRRVDRE
jgi:hypothetical protein